MSRFTNQPSSKPTQPQSRSKLIRTAEEAKVDSGVVGFGQYRNKTWNDVADMNPSYIVWCFENVTNRKLCSAPLAAWCGFVDKTQRAQASDNAGDDMDLRDIPDDDIPF